MQQQISSSSIFRIGIRRLGVSVLCFGVTFFCSAIFLCFLFSIDRFPVHFGDRFVTLRDLASEEQSLREQEKDVLRFEQQFSLDRFAPRLAMVRSLRSSSSFFTDVFPAFSSAQQSIATLSSLSFDVSDASFDAATHTLRLTVRMSTGTARDQSMILASFVDALRLALPSYSILEPSYPSHVQSAPFSFSLTILVPHA